MIVRPADKPLLSYLFPKQSRVNPGTRGTLLPSGHSGHCFTARSPERHAAREALGARFSVVDGI
jgi:hypothetical protein